mmetsp:Transcript_27574/g.77247  ORF Transcript_27574/g.77247 Transcript_27574/m.77247 type:complete len:222 (+) Transcript_27574:183-848(+)
MMNKSAAAAAVMTIAALAHPSNAFVIQPKTAVSPAAVTTQLFVSLRTDGNFPFDKHAHEKYDDTAAMSMTYSEDRAKQCASEFGECSVEELRFLCDELHSERVQGLLFGDIGRVETEKELEHHLLEEELTLQLQLLQDEMPPTTLFADIAKDFKMFPEVEDKMPELPHLKDGTTAALARKSIQEHQNQFWFDKMMEEGIVESLAFCALIAMAWAIPNMVLN